MGRSPAHVCISMLMHTKTPKQRNKQPNKQSKETIKQTNKQTNRVTARKKYKEPTCNATLSTPQVPKNLRRVQGALSPRGLFLKPYQFLVTLRLPITTPSKGPPFDKRLRQCPRGSASYRSKKGI